MKVLPEDKPLTLREELRLRVFENRVLRRIFVGRMGRGVVCTGFWWGNLRERDHWGDPGVDERINIKRGFQEVGYGRVWTGLSWLRIETVG
jgi:hypothetical protein